MSPRLSQHRHRTWHRHPRWSQATNILIEKDLGNPNIHRLRIIHLFEADFNFSSNSNGVTDLVRHAEKLNLLNEGQHGSRPGRTAMDPIMLIQLTTDLSRLLKTNLARFDNDASACYDRIIVALGMLAARRLGMPDNAIRTHAEALQFMKYTVKTIHGISEDTYQGTPFEPLFGTGQGSGASPAVWLTLVVILLNTLDRSVPERTHFSNPQASIQSSRLVDAFVDDTSLGFTDTHSTYEDMIQRLQAISQTWEHLLHLSGGALNLKKCSWYILYWDWKNGRPVLRAPQPTDPTVTLQQGSKPQPASHRGGKNGPFKGTTDPQRSPFSPGRFLPANKSMQKHGRRLCSQTPITHNQRLRRTDLPPVYLYSIRAIPTRSARS
ncbi:hypothetical protein MHU86_17080 [Fragilaria crotonensis]|nr:hypothetical protein MHU86_17080 [Fragilaria crotonensis]